MADVEIMSFADVDEWDRWLAEHAETRTEAWLKVAKRGQSGLTASEAGDVAICHGWIDSHRRGLDATHFLQRYSPRRAGSPWSRRKQNVFHLSSAIATASGDDTTIVVL